MDWMYEQFMERYNSEEEDRRLNREWLDWLEENG